MTKFVKKSDCIVRQGYIVHDDEVIGLPLAVAGELEKLIFSIQAANYNENNQPSKIFKTPEKFEPKMSYNDWHRSVTKVETPALDKAVEEALAIVDDIEHMEKSEKIDELLKEYQNLLMFIEEDEFLPGICPDRLGVPDDLNPLTMTVDDFKECLVQIVEYGCRPFNMPDADPETVHGLYVDWKKICQ